MTAQTAAPSIDPCRSELAAQVSRALHGLLPSGTTAPEEFLAAKLSELLEKPPEQELGDFALPCFRFARALQRKPNEIAQLVADNVAASGSPWVEKTVVAGAFCNIFVKKSTLAREVLPKVLDGSFFTLLKNRLAPQNTKVMIEYSAPNTHKEYHIGHARNVSLGLSLVNLFRYCGYPTIAANFIGDEGTHIAKCLWHIQKTNAQSPATGRGEWLGMKYTEANAILEAATGDERVRLDQEVSQVLAAIESKKGPTYEFWKISRQWSLDEFEAIFAWTGAKFDRMFFESDVSEDSQTLVDEYLKRGVFIESDGAIGIDLKAHKLGFMIVRKRDGNTIYATKDLVLARRKFDEHHIDRSVYVVGNEQNYHFRQVFKALELMGFEQAKKCFHLSYGMVTRPEGKMSSRDGTSITFSSLRASVSGALQEHLQKYEAEWSKDEIASVGKMLCDGAIKYGMLHSDPVKDIVFDLSAWVSFEGNSGPYLMYSYARTQSILRKAQAEYPEALHLPLPIGSFDHLTETSEHALVRSIYDFNDVVSAACENYRPSTLASHLFYLCKSFNRFYADVQVLKAENPETRRARLALVAAFAATLRQGLALLGMTAPDRM